MYQKLMIAGYLGSDPEVRFTPSGVQVANFNVATKYTWVNSQGEKQEETTWFRCAAWGKLSDVVGKYLHKGSAVLVEGMVKANAFTKSDGTPGASLEVRVDQLRFLDRSSGASPAASNEEENPLW